MNELAVYKSGVEELHFILRVQISWSL